VDLTGNLTDITGIGSTNILTVNVGNAARMDMESLDRLLENCLKNERAVYAVVAVIGSAEHGSCDPLGEIIRIRKKVLPISFDRVTS
jgi:glutamate/tyrosine decarboxylase-like PLP-dependent enzyme